MININNVHMMTIREISELWEKSLKINKTIIERELRIAMLKLENEYPFHENIKFIPKEEELPSPDTIIRRDFIEKFCDKEGWKLPNFWFNGLPTERSFPGRPSVISAIVQELEKRAEEGQLADTLAEESRQLAAWAKQKFPGEQTPKPTSTANGIRIAYRLAKRNAG